MTEISQFADRLEAVLPAAVEAVTTLPDQVEVVALVFHDPSSDVEIWCCSEARRRELFQQQQREPDPMHLWDAYQFDGRVAEDDYRRIVAPVWDEVIAYALTIAEDEPAEGEDDREIARAVTLRVARALNTRSETAWASNLAPLAVTYPAGPAREPENQELLEATITDAQRRRLDAAGMLWPKDWV
jgi:hypothetical protein